MRNGAGPLFHAFMFRFMLSYPMGIIHDFDNVSTHLLVNFRGVQAKNMCISTIKKPTSTSVVRPPSANSAVTWSVTTREFQLLTRYRAFRPSLRPSTGPWSVRLRPSAGPWSVSLSGPPTVLSLSDSDSPSVCQSPSLPELSGVRRVGPVRS